MQLKVFILFFVLGHLAAAKPPPKLKPPAKTSPGVIKLRNRVNRILVPSRNRSLKASILAVSLDRNEVIYSRSADTTLIPASVNKILTAYTALKRVGPRAKFHTKILATDSIRNGVLGGNLYLKGGGDPGLVSERMWMLTNELLRSGVKKITGNIIGDASYFDTERTPDNRPKYLTDQAYNAPVGALSFNFNTTTIFVRPGTKVGTKPEIYVDPENSYVDIVNQAKTTKAGRGTKLYAKRLKHLEGDLGDTILIRGTIARGAKEVRYYRNIVNPTLYTCHMFKTFLERRGVKVNGTIKMGRVPKKARLLVDFGSLPMWQVIWGLNKFSNNFVADQVLKKVGAEMWGVPGNLKKGMTSMRDALEDIGIPRNSYVVVDGSGLNRKARISSNQIVQILRSAYADFSIRSEFVASLGVAGEDGTLKRRLNSNLGRGFIRGKTGRLNGVNSLAGYTQSVQGENIAFAILLNDPSGRHGDMTGWVDQIAMAFRRFRR